MANRFLRFAPALVLVSSIRLLAQTAPAQPTVCESCLKAEVTYLASDELRGRGGATADELAAANHIAGIFKKLGLEPPEGGNQTQARQVHRTT